MTRETPAEILAEIRSKSGAIATHLKKIRSGEYRSFGAALALQKLQRQATGLRRKLPELRAV